LVSSISNSLVVAVLEFYRSKPTRKHSRAQSPDEMLAYAAMGYQAPTRQPLRHVQIGPFRMHIDDDIERLDADLESLFGPDWDHLEPASRQPAPADDNAWARMIGERILAVAAYLQRSARIPALTSGHLLEASVSRASPAPAWAFAAEVPVVDGVPPRISNGAYEQAIRTLAWCSSGADRPSASAFQDELEHRFVKPAGRALQETGKSGIFVAMGAFLADVPFAHIGSGRYLLGWGSRAVLTHRSSVGTDSAIGCKIATRKSLSADLLRIAGLPVPENHLVGSPEQALKAAERLAWPVVVKPNDRERGEGVTIGIRSEAGLRKAFAQARHLSQSVLVEKHVEGVCHRVLVVRGRVLLVVKRNPQQVEGDGARSIEALIDAKNLENQQKPPWARAAALPALSEIKEWLAARSLEPGHIPEEGEVVPLRPFESVLWGGHSEVITEHIHPENADICLRAAFLLGIDVAGVDLITTDISVPWRENGAVINEVNHAPLFAVKPQRKHLLREFVEAILPDGGRIPVHLVIGGREALKRGRDLQMARCADGERCFLTAGDSTLRPDGSVMPSTMDGLYGRTRSLLLDRTVDSIVMVAEDDRLLETGMPVDRLQSVDETCTDGNDWAHRLAVWARRFTQDGQA